MGKAQAKPEPAEEEASGDNVSAAARDLASYVERVEKLIDERKTYSDDIKEVFGEAKSKGYDPKIMRMVIKRRAMDRAELEAQDAMLANYETNLDTVLG